MMWRFVKNLNIGIDIILFHQKEIANRKSGAREIVGSSFKTIDELLIFHPAWISDIDNVQAEYFARGGNFLVTPDGGRVIVTGAMRSMDEET